MIQRRVFVSGHVQGVGFRASTADEASKFPSVIGYVRNLEDGRVEALFQGPQDAVLALVAWCKHGPSSAKVTGLKIIEEQPEAGLASFSITRK